MKLCILMKKDGKDIGLVEMMYFVIIIDLI